MKLTLHALAREIAGRECPEQAVADCGLLEMRHRAPLVWGKSAFRLSSVCSLDIVRRQMI
ncbi:hypothetical protein [Methylobacterium frigidaeris]|uniref:hypothetical protein n=1 Tax=Methylobacterium frigidaeris TaxID=2038277 RepID=UPI001EE084D0|nr:hypothetical protein [Methylobacterium frigidaeris]